VSARISFAVECVDGLHYLCDIDEQLVPLDAATDVLGHNWQVVDMAHVRWAAGSAITALDLCTAALGRLYCGISGDDARDLDLEGIKRREHRDALRAAQGDPAAWAARVRGDYRYSQLLDLRHQLTHRVRPRHYKVELHEALQVSDCAEIAPQTLEERTQAQDGAHGGRCGGAGAGGGGRGCPQHDTADPLWRETSRRSTSSGSLSCR
jgi:hypothetical protein